MRTLLLAAAAAAGLAGSAVAQGADTHVMTVVLPNGAVQQIQYVGDVPPRVVMAQPVMPSPFAIMDQLMADMDRQAAAMFQAMSAAPFGIAPVGAAMPQAIAAGTGTGACFRSMSVTFNGTGAPKVVTRSAGDCGGESPHAAPAVTSPVPAPQAPGTIEVKGPVYQPPAKGWLG